MKHTLALSLALFTAPGSAGAEQTLEPETASPGRIELRGGILLMGGSNRGATILTSGVAYHRGLFYADIEGALYGSPVSANLRAGPNAGVVFGDTDGPGDRGTATLGYAFVADSPGGRDSYTAHDVALRLAYGHVFTSGWEVRPAFGVALPVAKSGGGAGVGRAIDVTLQLGYEF